jgi:hypothetical protein
MAQFSETTPVPEDALIRTLQNAILAAMKAGATFSTAHKEGGSQISWNGSRFQRRDYGDFPDHITYADDAEFLGALRRFFDWQVSRDVWPAKPSEAEAWRGIHKLLQYPSPPAPVDHADTIDR